MNKIQAQTQSGAHELTIPDIPYFSRVLSPQSLHEIERHILLEYPEVLVKRVTPSHDHKGISISLISSSISQDRIVTLAQQASLLTGMHSEVRCLLVDESTSESPYLSRLVPILSPQVNILSACLRKGALHLTFTDEIPSGALPRIEQELHNINIRLRVEGTVSLEQPRAAKALPSYKIIDICDPSISLLSKLPSEDIALLFTNKILQLTSPHDVQKFRDSIHKILEEELPTANYTLKECGPNLLLTFDKSALISDTTTLYTTLHRIRAAVPISLPLLVGYSPVLSAPPDTTVGASLRIRSTEKYVSSGLSGYSMLYQNALSRLGTKSCWYFIEDTREKTVTLLTNEENPKHIHNLLQEGKQLVRGTGYTLSIRKLTPHPLESIHTSLSRNSFSIREWKDVIQFANEVCTSNIKDSPIEAVYALGNIVVTETNFYLPDACRLGIRQLLRMVPAPIMIRSKRQSIPKLSLAAVKSILKLGLPNGAVIRNCAASQREPIGKSSRPDEISLLIIGHHRDTKRIHKLCDQLQSALKDQKLLYSVESYKKKASTKVDSLPPPLYRYLLPGIDSVGEVDLSTPKKHSVRKISPSFIGHREEEGWLNSLASSHRDSTDTFCWTVDPMGATLKEDAISVKVHSQDSFTLTVHLSNVALSCPSFSTERHKAYKLGESIYDSSRNVFPMLPHTHLFSLNVGSVRPVISISWSFDRNNDGVWDITTKAPEVSNDLISVKAALSTDPSGKAIAVEGHLPLKSDQLCCEIAAKVLMTGRLIQSSDSFAQWAVNQQQQHFLAHANLALGTYLRSSGLPLIYQQLKRPSFDEFIAFTNKLSIKEFRRLTPLSLNEIYSNDDFLRRFIMRVKDYYRFARKGNRTPFSMLGQPTLKPDYHFIYGEEGVALFNAPARRALSLVNTHQLCAFQGLVEPLSQSEVNEAFNLHQENPKFFSRENSQITLARQLDKLRRRDNHRLRAIVTEMRPGKVGIDAVLRIQNSKLALTGVIENVGSEGGFSNLSSLVKGSELYVNPSRYSHTEDRFYFSIAPEQ